MTIKLAVTGCQGRMGQRITSLALEDSSFEVIKLFEHKDHPNANETVNNIQISTSTDDLKGADVLIDFTTPSATVDNIDKCVEYGVKMVIGTTGLTEEQIEKIRQSSSKVPIVFASNMSIGVNILFNLAKQLTVKSPEMYSCRIVEAHHIHKKDAPSGTAKTLGDIIEKNSSRKVDDIESIREDEIVGDHDVIFESPEDTIVIKHHAKSRDIFAKGSLTAAKFIADKTSGLFNMQDVLDLQ